ncbi:hypothetical protein Q5P01_020010 [Channa striata]|uniref:Uncharacterized protein n=1 Tax=Channa striata TaxID=64152 RepID=A0AA88LWQ2_CHASR|nr:hypothetical protein Q5P01_020010 [Channa striata]
MAPRGGPVNELWLGEEWKDVQIKGESPMMISPGMMIADCLRNPSLVGCRKWYRVTVEGSDATGIPAGSVLEGTAKNVQMEIARPYSRVVRPTCKHLYRSTVIPVVVGLWTDLWVCGRKSLDALALARKEVGRLFEQDNVNTTLVEKALGYPLSKTLVLDPVVESDLKGAFFCKLESTSRNDVVSVFHEARRDGTEGTTSNGNLESEHQAVTRGPR